MRYIFSILLLASLGATILAKPQEKFTPQETELWSPKPPVVTPANNVGAPPVMPLFRLMAKI